MTTEDGDVDPADQHSSNQRFHSRDTSGAGEPEITSTAGDNQHLYQDIKNLQEAVSLPLTHSLPPLQSSASIPMSHSFSTFEIVSFLHYVKLWSAGSEETGIELWLPRGVVADQCCFAFNSYKHHR